MKTTDAIPDAAPVAGSFPSTQWSIVFHAGAGPDTEGRAALEALCRRYWYPLYVYCRRLGYPHHAAEDCTQEFFARLLANEAFARARPERGRFRTFLLTSLRHFLTNEWHRAQTVKRGEGQKVWSLEAADAEQRYQLEPADPGLTPEQAYDRHWAQGLIEQALASLRDEYGRSGRGTLFQTLEPLVRLGGGTEPHAVLAGRLGLKPHAFTVALERLRRRLGEQLRRDVAQTVADPAEVDAELRHLIVAVS